MKNYIGVCFILIAMCGCTTRFPDPINDTSDDIRYAAIRAKKPMGPVIKIVQQGSLPADKVYRELIFIDANGKTNRTREIITAEIIGAIAQYGFSSATDSTKNYYETLQKNYRWRTDVFIYGYPDISEKEIKEIIRYGMWPQGDMQKSFPTFVVRDTVPISNIKK